MAKEKQFYLCSSCEYRSIKWLGCCPNCQEWETLKPQTLVASSRVLKSPTVSILEKLQDIHHTPLERMHSGIPEWDRVVGGGIMPGSLLILSGDPGIGKSTLLLQVSHALAQKYRVFYFSTEESLEQVRLRASRINALESSILFSDTADLEIIIQTAQQEKPDVLILDSIQNCSAHESAGLAGSTGQLREATFQLMRLAKEHRIAVILTGHITKEGVMAGPKTLEHMVDAVFYLHGEDKFDTRILRSVKNRFGTIHELGFFTMSEHGLTSIIDINEHVLNEYTHAPGSCLVGIMEGSRPLFVELQALTIESKLSLPQRVISGVDHKQVMLIAAILQKYLHIRLNMHDIFFKVTGGLTLRESSCDLGIALALLSSYFQCAVPAQTLALGEISLTGHIKPINYAHVFAKEAQKFGMHELVVAHNQKINHTYSQIRYYKTVYDLLSLFPTT